MSPSRSRKRINKPQSSRERAEMTGKGASNPRKAANLAAAKQIVLFGVEIGGTKIQVVAGNHEAKILGRHRFTVDPSRGAAGILSQIRSGFESLLQKLRPLSAAIGFGGPVDWRTGVTCRSHQ